MRFWYVRKTIKATQYLALADDGLQSHQCKIMTVILTVHISTFDSEFVVGLVIILEEISHRI